MENKRIHKDNKEFIIVSYNQDKNFAILVVEGKDVYTQFPFKNIEEAEAWVEKTSPIMD
jgi:hypothetical protein